MTKFNYKLYESLSKLHQIDLHKSMNSYLVKHYTQERVVELEDGFVYAVGDIPIMLVAHMDTVHKVAPLEIFYDKEKQVIWSPQGIGADDRAGVYAIIDILKRGHRPHVLLTWDEEVGAVGASVAASVLKPEIDFVIELDRRGINDCVFYECDNPDFEKYIESFGFEKNYGSFSDICYICPEWGVAGVNLSIGYVDEHTFKERLYVENMMSTIDKVENILLNKDYNKEDFKFIECAYSPSAYGYNYSYGYGETWSGYGSYNSYSTKTDTTTLKSPKVELDGVCCVCGTVKKEKHLIPLDAGDYCATCYDKFVLYCRKCKSLYDRVDGCKCNE